MDNADSLLCEEEAIASPYDENIRSPCSHFTDDQRNASIRLLSHLPLDQGESLASFLKKECVFMPKFGYLGALKSQGIAHARSTAVQWILKVRSNHSFSPVTVSLAVNYFDRYLSSHLSKSWKAWMGQLLSVACLSIAAKMEEIDVPTLLDLQFDGMEHLFEAKTIQRMELAVLDTLGWRMSSVTVFSFADELLLRLEVSNRLRNTLAIRVTELLLGSFSEVDFLEFRPSVITLAAVSCALEEAVPLQAETFINTLLKLFPLSDVELEKCCRLMEELVADPVCTLTSFSQVFGNPASPVSVAQVPPKENACRDAAGSYSNLSHGARTPKDVVPIMRYLSSRKRKLEDFSD